MPQVLHVATRKGLLSYAAAARGAWRIARTSFLGEPVSAVMHDPRDGALYAALDLGHFGVKLHRSDDAGASWQEIAPPAYAEEKDQPPHRSHGGMAAPKKEGPSVALIWTLVPGGADRPGVLWAGTVPGGLFRSDDRGASWQLVESLWNDPSRAHWFGGGYDQRRHAFGAGGPARFRPADRRASRPAASGAPRTRARAGRSFGEWHAQRIHAARQAATTRSARTCTACQACAARPGRRSGCSTTTASSAPTTAPPPSPRSRPTPRRASASPSPRTREDPKTAWFVPAIKDQYRVAVDGRLVRHAHPRRRAELPDLLRRPAAGGLLRPDLPPRARPRSRRRAPRHGLDHRQPVGGREGRRKVDATSPATCRRSTWWPGARRVRFNRHSFFGVIPEA